MAEKSLILPEPMGIKPLETATTSIYLRWAILSNHGLSKQQLSDLDFEFKTNKLNAVCTDNAPVNEYKARLCGLSPDTKYRFQIRSKLELSVDQVIYSKWSNRIEITTRANMDHFIIISGEKELELESLKHRLRMYMDDNKKLRLQIKQLELKANDSSFCEPGHWQWDARKIVNWMMRIQDGICRPFRKQLLKNLKNEGITGKELSLVSEDDLRKWGIGEFRPRKIVMQYIKTLTEHDPKQEIAYDPALTEQLSQEHVEKDQKTEEELEEQQKQEQEQEQKQEQEQEQDKEEDDAANPMITGTSGLISASVADLLYDHTVEKKEWKYKEGMLSVTVIRARNVDNMDKDEGEEGQSDPYVELDLKGNYKKENTKTIYDEANPVWQEKFQLFVDDARNDVLKARVYDRDKWLADDKIGEVHIPVITVLGANGHLRKEFDVLGSKTGCTLELELKYWESLR